MFPCLLGMGRPASDDEGGFKSPNGDMMTLEEFLAEGMDKTSPKNKVSSLIKEGILELLKDHVCQCHCKKEVLVRSTSTEYRCHMT